MKASTSIFQLYFTQPRDSFSVTATRRAPATAAMMVQWTPGS